MNKPNFPINNDTCDGCGYLTTDEEYVRCDRNGEVLNNYYGKNNTTLRPVSCPLIPVAKKCLASVYWRIINPTEIISDK